MSTWTFPKTLFQSTLPRGERRLQLRFSRWGIRISIHAPARGATYLPCVTGHYRSISIHAPARGATQRTRGEKRSLPYFNPRSREGSDNAAHPRRCAGGDFNPRSREGSDHTVLDRNITVEDFNPRSREGSDRSGKDTGGRSYISIHAPARGATFSSASVQLAKVFQSTLPRGERRLFWNLLS